MAPTSAGPGESGRRPESKRRGAGRAEGRVREKVGGGSCTDKRMGACGRSQTLPIIYQPRVARRATDGIRKEPVVVEGRDGDDAIAVHHVGFLSLAWDHRAFDGAYAASFLNALRVVLETRDWEAELA